MPYLTEGLRGDAALPDPRRPEGRHQLLERLLPTHRQRGRRARSGHRMLADPATGGDTATKQLSDSGGTYDYGGGQGQPRSQTRTTRTGGRLT